MMKRLSLLSATIILALTVIISYAPPAYADSSIKSNIIDDIVFDNQSSMTLGQIESFINRFPASCLLPQNQPSGLSPVTFKLPSSYWDYGSTTTPAHIIYWSTQYYHLNPQVLLSTLEKESNLVSGSQGCETWRYNSAMGYNCPDNLTLNDYPSIGITHTCVERESNAGFSRQINHATWQLRFDKERAYGNLAWGGDGSVFYAGRMTQGYRSRQTGASSIYYDGYTTIDGESVYLSNGATAALYNYTPHFSNFYTIFTNWFGTTRAFVALETPRWMEINSDTYKKNPSDDSNVDSILVKGTQLKFTSKVSVNGKLYLRTAYDSSYNNSKGVFIGDLIEIPYVPLPQPKYMELNANAYKLTPRSWQTDKSLLLLKGTQISVTDEITVNNTKYYRSVFDSQNNIDKAIPASSLTEVSYKPFVSPRYMVVTKDSQKTNPLTGTVDGTVITKNSQLKFTSKMFVNGILYFRTTFDTDNNNQLAINSSNLKEIVFEPYSVSPKWMQLRQDSQKISVPSADPTGTFVGVGTQLRIIDRILMGSEWYYRSEYDYSRGNRQGLLASDFIEIPFDDMETPRIMQLKTDLQKIFPKTGQTAGGVLGKGMKISFKTRIYINGKMYLRTEYDTNNALETAIPLDKLSEVTS